MSDMIISTTNLIANREVAQTLGIVEGSAVRARFVALDIVAGIRSFFGGEVREYSNLLIQSREQARLRMCDAARKLGADAVVEVRYSTANVAQGTSEVLAYGTAVKLR